VIELVVNGKAESHRTVPADGRCHDVAFEVSIERSSWVALRHFPQLHTNPVDVLVAGRPVRASRRSALWCMAALEQLWKTRSRAIAASEREAARQAFDQAVQIYRKIAEEAQEGS
jgi:hypothetical protein